jgi:hypothetical protein
LSPSSVATAGTSPTPEATTSTAALPPRPKALVAVTTGGAVETLDASTGNVVANLATGATGDEVSLTPDGTRVFFETPAGCFHQVMSVAITGGTASLVAPGSRPSVSPDGTKLAYAVAPLGNGCPGGNPAAQYSVAIRPLAGGAPATLPLPPSLVSEGQTRTVNHLSWGPDSKHLLVSIDGGGDNKQWNAFIVDTAVDRSYVPANGGGVPVQQGAGFYYRQAVYLPDGNLFANLVCCSGAKKPTTTILSEVDPTGKTLHQISSGLTDRDHTSLDADASGHWVLYLAGSDLVASVDAASPTIVSTAGFLAADW